jgi:Xaa-Pro aminopeptidase
LLVSHQPNINYLTGFPSSDSYLLVTRKQNFFITDPRYYQEASKFLAPKGNSRAVKSLRVELYSNSVFDTITQLVRRQKVKRLGFEARNLDVAQYQRIKKLLGKIRFISTHEIIEQLRRLKEPSEIVKIKKSVSIARQALEYAKGIIAPGISEREIAAELEGFLRTKGARKTAFETIVASGRNSAFPHYLTGNRKLRQCDCLFVDFGVDYQGYKSDLTRTFFLGKIPSKISKIYQIVRQAQVKAINKIKPGVRIGEIDKSARQYIARHGYGGFFAHNLGHGIGLEIHEQPTISAHNKALLEEGMVFTIEPAIYLPNRFGIRIEDDIVVTKQGCEVLSSGIDKSD